MCKDLQENKINKFKFHEEIDQFIEQFKEQIIGHYFQYLQTQKLCSWIKVDMISKLRIMVNTLHLVILNWQRKRVPASSMQIAGTKPEN